MKTVTSAWAWAGAGYTSEGGVRDRPERSLRIPHDRCADIVRPVHFWRGDISPIHMALKGGQSVYSDQNEFAGFRGRLRAPNRSGTLAYLTATISDWQRRCNCTVCNRKLVGQAIG
mgnify:CR=1